MELAVINAENAAPNQKGIQVTERALKRIRVAMAKEGVSPAEGGLRLGIQGGGCSGLSYDMSWVEEAAPTDEKITDKGATVLIDRKATLFLIGTTMDFQSSALESGFSFVNPNEKGRCGCGESFHV